MGKENRRHLRDEIQSLLQNINAQPQDDLVLDQELKRELKQESDYDFDEMSKQLTSKAREITDALYKNFVDVGIFNKSEYHKYKKELDTINISNLFFQLKTVKIVIIKIMEEITTGNTHPRLIEVLGQMQDKLSAITKTQANYMLFLEETYRKLNATPSVNQDSASVGSNPQEGQFFVTVGTKNVIKNLPESNGVGEHYQRKEKSEGRLTDPSSKIDLMKEKNIQLDSDETTGDDFIDLTEII